MSSFSLNNFENILDPDLLDQGKAFFLEKKLKKVKENEPGFWDAEFEYNGKSLGLGLGLGRGQVVKECMCECDQFDGETWEDDPCEHIVALLYALSGKATPAKRGRPAKDTDAVAGSKPSKTKGKAATKAEKIPAKKKDPAEQLLSELDPKEIYEFLRGQILKNKELRGIFLMHFSDKDPSGDAKKYEEIVANTISAVKGRRKNLKGADGSKIATNLGPLYKQAAASEAKGYFREAMQIGLSIVEPLPDIFGSMETGSARLSNLYTQTYDVLGLVAENKATPLDLKIELQTDLGQLYIALATKYDGDLSEVCFQALMKAISATKLFDEGGKIFENVVDKLQSYAGKSYWSIESRLYHRSINQLLEYYLKVVKAEDKTLAIMNQHKDKNLNVYLGLVDFLTAKERYKEALQHLQALSNDQKKYSKMGWDVWGLPKIINNKKLAIHQKSNDKAGIAQTCNQIFIDSNYTDMGAFNMVKDNIDPKLWPAKLNGYLIETKRRYSPSLVWYANNVTYFDVLVAANEGKTLLKELSNANSVHLWGAYGDTVRQEKPEEYAIQVRLAIDKVQTSRSFDSHDYKWVATLFKKLAEMPEERDATKTLLDKVMTEHSKRRSLIDELKKIKI
jgi:hypothetical protein